jgi:hypothetical protein
MNTENNWREAASGILDYQINRSTRILNEAMPKLQANFVNQFGWLAQDIWKATYLKAYAEEVKTDGVTNPEITEEMFAKHLLYFIKGLKENYKRMHLLNSTNPASNLADIWKLECAATVIEMLEELQQIF